MWLSKNAPDGAIYLVSPQQDINEAKYGIFSFGYCSFFFLLAGIPMLLYLDTRLPEALAVVLAVFFDPFSKSTHLSSVLWRTLVFIFYTGGFYSPFLVWIPQVYSFGFFRVNKTEEYIPELCVLFFYLGSLFRGPIIIDLEQCIKLRILSYLWINVGVILDSTTMKEIVIEGFFDSMLNYIRKGYVEVSGYQKIIQELMVLASQSTQNNQSQINSQRNSKNELDLLIEIEEKTWRTNLLELMGGYYAYTTIVFFLVAVFLFMRDQCTFYTLLFVSLLLIEHIGMYFFLKYSNRAPFSQCWYFHVFCWVFLVNLTVNSSGGANSIYFPMTTLCPLIVLFIRRNRI